MRGERYSPRPGVGMPSWRIDLQGLFLLSPVVLGHLPVRSSKNCYIPFLSRMTSPLYSVNLPQEGSLPPSLILASPVEALE